MPPLSLQARRRPAAGRRGRRSPFLGRRARRHEHDRDRPLVIELGLRTEATSFVPWTPSYDLLRRLLIALDVDDDRDRPVETRPEARGEQVVGAATRLLLGLRPLVGGAEADERRRGGEGESDEQDDREDDLAFRVTNRPTVLSVSCRVPLRVVNRVRERHLEPVDLVTEQPEYGDSSEFAMSTVVSTPSALPIPSLSRSRAR